MKKLIQKYWGLSGTHPTTYQTNRFFSILLLLALSVTYSYAAQPTTPFFFCEVATPATSSDYLPTSLQVFPESVLSGGRVRVEMEVEQAKNLQIQVFDSDGYLVHLGQKAADGKQLVYLFQTEDWHPGAYEIRVITEKGGLTHTLTVID